MTPSKNNNSSNSRRLTPRDIGVLKDIGTHRITWFEVLSKTHFTGISATRSWLRRVAGRKSQQPCLRAAKLDEHRVFYQLTHKATQILGASKELARPVGPNALARLYARQWYLRLADSEPRLLCHPRDFPDLFPVHGHRLPQSNFFIENDAEGGKRFGFLLIDYGSDPRRIIRRAADNMDRFLSHGWFDDFIAVGRFVLVVATVTEGKAVALRTQLKPQLARQLEICQRKFPDSKDLPFELRVVVIPGLSEIVPMSRQYHSK